MLVTLSLAAAAFSPGYAPRRAMRSVAPRMEVAKTPEVAEGFGASHTSFYTDAVAKDSYDTLEKLLEEKMADAYASGVSNYRVWSVVLRP